MEDHLARLRNEMKIAADALLEALRAELTCGQLNAENPTEQELLDRWRMAREEVHGKAEKYAAAIERFREAVEAKYSSTSSKESPAAPEAPSEA